MEHSYSRLFVPMVQFSFSGTWTIRSRERMNPEPFVPQTIRSLEHLFLIIKNETSVTFVNIVLQIMERFEFQYRFR